MNQTERDVNRKKRALEYATRVGNVCRACRYFGVSKSNFYLGKKAYETHGEAGLVRRKPWPGS